MNPVAEKLAAAFKDPSVSEVMLNEDGSVYVEKPGAVLEKLPFAAGPEAVGEFMSALVGDTWQLGHERPFADLSAQDGSRVHVIAPPLIRSGVCVTVRKRPSRRPNLEELVKTGTLPPGCAGFLKYAVEHRKNLLVVGGASSGKTTLLNALAALAGVQERLLVLEDTPELTLPHPHVLYLKTRMRDSQGLPDVSLRDLIMNALRMRPDRLIVGECRGVEAAELLQAMNVGMEGVMATLHASSAREGLQRLETLVLLSGLDLPLRAVRSNIVQAVDIVLFMARLADGSRKLAQVMEITGMEGDTVTASDLFKLESRKSPGTLSFKLNPTGALPRFYEQLRFQGLEPPLDFFK